MNKSFFIFLITFLALAQASIISAQYCVGAMRFVPRDSKGRLTAASKFDAIEQHNDGGKDRAFSFNVEKTPLVFKNKNAEQQIGQTLRFDCAYANRIKLKFTRGGKTMVVRMFRQEGFGGYPGLNVIAPPFRVGTYDLNLSEALLRDEKFYDESVTVDGSRTVAAKNWKKASDKAEIENLKWHLIRDFNSIK